MSRFENIRNMNNINMSVLTKDLLTAKAALLDFNDFLIIAFVTSTSSVISDSSSKSFIVAVWDKDWRKI